MIDATTVILGFLVLIFIHKVMKPIFYIVLFFVVVYGIIYLLNHRPKFIVPQTLEQQQEKPVIEQFKSEAAKIIQELTIPKIQLSMPDMGWLSAMGGLAGLISTPQTLLRCPTKGETSLLRGQIARSPSELKKTECIKIGENHCGFTVNETTEVFTSEVKNGTRAYRFQGKFTSTGECRSL